MIAPFITEKQIDWTGLYVSENFHQFSFYDTTIIHKHYKTSDTFGYTLFILSKMKKQPR
jgi:hypothetical protein